MLKAKDLFPVARREFIYAARKIKNCIAKGNHQQVHPEHGKVRMNFGPTKDDPENCTTVFVTFVDHPLGRTYADTRGIDDVLDGIPYVRTMSNPRDKFFDGKPTFAFFLTLRNDQFEAIANLDADASTTVSGLTTR